MPRTGPQRYPGASTTYWYQDDYPGSPMEVNVVVLHTTEGRTLPDYGGGASAPNLTAVPDLEAKRLRWFQHFDIETSSRALRNLTGGVETNTLNVCQVELVGTCDPGTHTKWGPSPHIFWPEAPEWALAELAEFLAWMHEQHAVPLTGPSSWLPYPSSYGDSSARMSGSSWSAFKGVCGHMHVPENDHGDPGALDFARLIALAQGSTTPATEDAMPTAAEIAAEVAKVLPRAVWLTNGIIKNPNAATAPDSPYITASTGLRNIEVLGRRIDKRTAEQTAQIAALSAAVAALAQGGGLDAAEIQAAAEAGARAALDRLGDALTEES